MMKTKTMQAVQAFITALTLCAFVTPLQADQISESAKAEQTKAMDHKEAVVKNYVKALNAKDISVIKAMFADNASVSDPWGTPAKEGHAAVVNFFELGAFNEQAKLSAELTGPIRVAGNSAAFNFNVFFNGMKLEVIDVFEFNDEGKVEVMKAYWSSRNITPVK